MINILKEMSKDRVILIGLQIILGGGGLVILSYILLALKAIKGIEFTNKRERYTENVIDKLDMKVARVNSGFIEGITKDIIERILRGMYCGSGDLIPWSNLNDQMSQNIKSRIIADYHIGLEKQLYGLQIPNIYIRQENKHYMQSVSTVSATVDIIVSYCIKYGVNAQYENKQYKQEFVFNTFDWTLVKMSDEYDVTIQKESV